MTDENPEIDDSRLVPRAEIGERLREARAKIFKTAAEAARSLDMKPVTVRAHETGQNRPSYYDLERYARRYGVNVEWLMLGRAAKEPNLKFELSGQGFVFILAYVQDGVFLEDDPTSDYFPVHNTASAEHGGHMEQVAFSDPRYPDDWIDGYKVISTREEGLYSNGTVLFAVPFQHIGYGEGDHLIMVRTKGNFCEWTLRKVVRGPKTEAGEYWYEALTSDDEPFQYADGRDGVRTEIMAIVIGQMSRRKNTQIPDISTRREVEQYRLGLYRKSKRLPPPVK